ncbi:MAG: TldD/PmbA family protein [Candidatus Heimdallarchaeota archaeon]
MLDILEKSVTFGETLGARFVDARYDNLTLRTLQRINDVWKDVLIRSRTGVGITAYFEGAKGYAFTGSTDTSVVKETVKRAVKLAKATASAVSLKLEFENGDAVNSASADLSKRLIKIHPDEKDLDFKIGMVDRALESAREHGKNINTVRALYGELYGKKLFTNSDHSIIDWEFEVVDLRTLVTSKTDEGHLVNGFQGYGGTWGLEVYNNPGKTPEAIGASAGESAKEQLEAKACPGGKFRALTENRLTGVLAHESFGHLSEGDFVVTGGSPLTDKIGKHLGSKYASIIDTGTPDISSYGGLWVPFDDQGIRGGETVVLDQGILQYYLHDRGTANYLDQKPTGNCRALHFGYGPIPRMTNTYFTPGDLNEEEALELLDTGIYAIQTSGGQVSLDGFFVFKAVRGYWVENGEKKYPLREVSLSGNILNLLGMIEGATRDLSLNSGYFGGCGKGGQYPLPVGLGGPKLVFSEVTFGGKAGT